MFKKRVTVFFFLFVFTLTVMGVEKTEGNKSIKLYGSFEAGYKVQNDFKSPSDMTGWATEGAANRSKQPVNQHFEATLVAMTYADGPIKYPEVLVVAQIKFDPNQPDFDYSDEETFSVGEAFLMWKPHLALNLKIGQQTLMPTINDFHLFYGGVEFGIGRAGSITTDAAGLTIGAYLGSANHEAGVSMVNGSPVVSEVYTAITKQADFFVKEEGGNRTTAFWYEGKLFDKALHIVAAHQTVQLLRYYVPNSLIRAEGDKHDQYGEYLSHTVTSLGVSYDAGFIKPYLGTWQAAGEAPWKDNTINKMELTGLNLGIEINDLGPGQLALDFSTISTPEPGEEACSNGFVDFEWVFAAEYTMEMLENFSMRLTYQYLKTGTYWTEGPGTADEFDSNKYDWSDTSMAAVSLNYKFE